MKKWFAVWLLLMGMAMSAGLAEVKLPPFVYTGEDPIEGAVATYMAESDMSQSLAWQEGSVVIPAPVLVRTEMQDDTHANVYGNFWSFAYVLEDGVLTTVSGSEAPGIMTLEKTGDTWQVTGRELAGEGEDYARDIRRFCQGDPALEEMMFTASDAQEEIAQSARRRLIQEYAAAQQLPVYAYQDPYWDPIPLFDGPDEPITGSIEEGSYVIRVPVAAYDKGEWRADPMAQDDSVVKLAYAQAEEGQFTARYDPVGDGSATVYLRHYDGIACDQMLGFDLAVKDGKVQEATGGSHTASPLDDDLEPFIAGKWLEKETQFTQLTISRNEKKGWNAMIVSPLTHGAYAVTMTLYFDCEWDAYVYADAQVYDLPVEDAEALGEPVLTHESGRLALTTDDTGDMALVWYADHKQDAEQPIVFEREKAEINPYAFITDACPEAVEDFAHSVRQAYLDQDWATMAGMIRYPLAMDPGEEINNAEEFLAWTADRILPEESRKALEEESCTDLFANGEGVSMASGLVWFDDVHFDGIEQVDEPLFQIISLSGMQKK